MKLVREPRAGGGERGKRKQGVGIVVRNPKLKYSTKNLKIYRFFLKKF
jgi:hypothetical protein